MMENKTRRCEDVPLQVPVTGEYDVLVCGGGPAGCAAALAAARAGLSVLLVEATAQLGGMGTSGLVSHWLGGRSHDGRWWVVGGIFRELAREAAKRGIATLPVARPGQRYTQHGWLMGLVHGVPFDPFRMAAFLDEKVAAAGADVLFETTVVEAMREGDRLGGVVLAGKGGLCAVRAAAVIDATGDADIATRAGCEVRKGRDEDGLMAPGTLMFHVDNADQDALSAYIHEHDQPRFRALIEELRAAGVWGFPYDIFICVQLEEEGTLMINTPRICGVDGTAPRSRSDAYRRARAENLRLLEVLRAHFPGFRDARLKAVAPLFGIRETRRIVGDFTLTVEDVASGRGFADTIGYSSYGWDLPDPKRPSLQPLHERGLKKPPFIPIPYRVMVPRGVANLVCPGRAVSVERDVLGPLRVMAPVMAMGEAAGRASVQVAREGRSFAGLDMERLRAELRRSGAIVDAADITDVDW